LRFTKAGGGIADANGTVAVKTGAISEYAGANPQRASFTRRAGVSVVANQFVVDENADADRVTAVRRAGVAIIALSILGAVQTATDRSSYTGRGDASVVRGTGVAVVADGAFIGCELTPTAHAGIQRTLVRVITIFVNPA
jgi:hypothetical protein